MKRIHFALAGCAAILAASCKRKPAPAPSTTAAAALPATADVCANADGVLDDAAFVFVNSPHSGDRVSPGFTVTGCSRTFESTVNWRLTALDGNQLSIGHAQGGGVDGPHPFSFQVDYKVMTRQIGHLEVFEADASDGKGFPPGRNVIPLVLNP